MRENVLPASLREKAEWIVLHSEGPSVPLTDFEISRLDHELQVHQIELEMQNEQLLEKEAQLEAALDKYRRLYDLAPTGYLTLDREGVIQNTNLAAAYLVGVDQSLLLNRRFAIFVTPEEGAFFTDFLRNVFEKTHATSEVTLLRQNNIRVQVRIEGTVSDDGTECLVILSNVTDLKQAEKALRESEFCYKTLFEHAGVAIAHADAQGNFLRFNDHLMKFTGYSQEELAEMNVFDLLHPDSAAHTLHSATEQAPGRREGFSEENWYLCKGGTLRWGDTNFTPIRNDQGGVQSIILTICDKTEKKRALEALLQHKKELQQQTQALREANTALKVLLANMEKNQDEIKEMLLANMKENVLPYLERLKTTNLTETQKGFLQIAESYLNNISSPFAQKLTSTEFNLTSKEVQIAQLIKEGKTSKEIATLLNSSQRTIEFHRENIRKKLDLKDKKGNLQILLRTLD